MVKIYVNLIISGVISLSDVPASLKSKVIKMLQDKGYIINLD